MAFMFIEFVKNKMGVGYINQGCSCCPNRNWKEHAPVLFALVDFVKQWIIIIIKAWTEKLTSLSMY